MPVREEPALHTHTLSTHARFIRSCSGLEAVAGANSRAEVDLGQLLYTQQAKPPSQRVRRMNMMGLTRSLTVMAACVGVANAFATGGRLRSLVTNPNPRPTRGTSSVSMLGVVITGGANGVGYAYADEFLARRHAVVICDIKDPAPAVAALKKKHPGEYCTQRTHVRTRARTFERARTRTRTHARTQMMGQALSPP